MKYVIIVLILIVLLYIFANRGNNKFWQLVNKNQMIAYDFFVNNDCWFVIHPWENKEKPTDGEWVGPFYVPIIGIGKLKIYGKKGYFEKKQKEFCQKF